MKKHLLLFLFISIAHTCLAQTIILSELSSKVSFWAAKTDEVRRQDSVPVLSQRYGFQIDSIDIVLKNSLAYCNGLELMQKSESQKAQSLARKLEELIEAYKTAITASDKETISVKTASFIRSIRNLQKFLEDNSLPNEDGDARVNTGDTEVTSGNTEAVSEHVHEGETDSKSAEKNPHGDAMESNKSYMIAQCISIILMLVMLVMQWYIVKETRRMYTEFSKQNESKQHTDGNYKIQKKHSEIKESESISTSLSDLKEQIARVSTLQESTKWEIERIAQLLPKSSNTQGQQYSGLQETISPKPKPVPKPVVSTLSEYGNIGNDPNIVYQTNNSPKPEDVLEIRYTEADKELGELFVRSDLSPERVTAIQQNTYSLLPAEVGESVGASSMSPTHIVTVRCGKVKREGYNWRIIEPLQYRFE